MLGKNGDGGGNGCWERRELEEVRKGMPVEMKTEVREDGRREKTDAV